MTFLILINYLLYICSISLIFESKECYSLSVSSDQTTIFCPKCHKELEDTANFCSHCGTKIDKRWEIDEKELAQFLKHRKNTLDVLERVIEKLVFWGKLGMGSNLVSSGANIVSAALRLAVPTKHVAVLVDVVASGLGIVNAGGSVLTAVVENSLLSEANEVCKTDHLLMSPMDTLKVIVSSRRLYNPAIIEKYKEYKEMRKSGKFEDCSFRPTQRKATISMLANFGEFLANAISLYNGNYLLVAGSIKEQRDILLAEYEGMKTYMQRDQYDGTND